MNSRFWQRHGLGVGLSVLVVFKLWLVHTEDIYASATEYDALWYVTSASNWYWTSPFSWTAFVRPPAYPLFIALVHLLGVPLRLAIELLQLSGYLVIIHAFRKIAVPNRVCLLAFAAMALHPASFQFNNYTMSDCFYAAILPLCVGGLLLTWFTAKLIHAVWTGFAFGILWNAREESFLIPILLLVFAILTVWRRRVRTGSWKNAASHWIRPLMAIALVLLAVVVAVNTANYRTFGAFAKSDLTSPAYTAAYNALLRIKPERLEHYVGISNEAVEKAYAVSPALAQVKPQLDGELGQNWRVPATKALGHPEFGPWIMWALRSVAANTDAIYATPESANAFYRQVAREINEACGDGRLPSRRVLLSFLDPGAISFLHYLPQSIGRTAALFAKPHQKIYEREDAIITSEQRALYDEMTGRRPGPPSPDEWNNLGWSGRLSISVENLVGACYPWIVIALFLWSLVALGLIGYTRRFQITDPVNAVVMLMAATILIRFLFFSFLDATWWTDDYERYLFPIMPLTSCFFVLLIYNAVQHWRASQKNPETS